MKRLGISTLVVTVLAGAQWACGLAASAPAQEPPAATSPAAEEVPGDSPGAPQPTPANPAQGGEQPVSQAIPALAERRMLALEFPPKMRAGDSERIVLSLEVDERGNITPTAEVAGNVVQGEVIEIPNVFETHNVVAEARLDLAGVDVRPTDAVKEPLRPGQKLVFYWSVSPANPGKYQGTLWFYLNFVSLADGLQSRRALSVQKIELEAVDLFGLKAGPARWLGLAGGFVSSVLGLPFLDEMLKFLQKRLRPGRNSKPNPA